MRGAPSNAWHAHLVQTYRSSNVPLAEAMKLASATYRGSKRNDASTKSMQLAARQTAAYRSMDHPIVLSDTEDSARDGSMFDPIVLSDDDDDAQVLVRDSDDEGEYFDIRPRRRRPGVVIEDDDEYESPAVRPKARKRRIVVSDDDSDDDADDDAQLTRHRDTRHTRTRKGDETKGTNQTARSAADGASSSAGEASSSAGGASSSAGGASSSAGACTRGISLGPAASRSKSSRELCQRLTSANLCASALRRTVVQRLHARFSPKDLQMPVDRKVLEALPELYDQVFFQNTLRAAFDRHGCTLRMCWNHRCSKTGGFTRSDKQQASSVRKPILIELSHRVFTQSQDLLQQHKRVTMGGLTCQTILDCILYTFEHELVHAMIRCFCVQFSGSNAGPGGDVHDNENRIIRPKASNGHSRTFLAIMSALFGHRDFKHNLFGWEVPSEKRFQVGEKVKVKFKARDGQSVLAVGTVIRVYKNRVRVRIAARALARFDVQEERVMLVHKGSVDPA